MASPQRPVGGPERRPARSQDPSGVGPAAPDESSRRPSDHQLESAVLSFAIRVHPALLTEDEMIAELALDPSSFPERDALSRAIDSLVRAGLLHRLSNLLVPSWPALKASELELG